MAINKRISVLTLTILVTVLAAALLAALTFGGGAKRTVASRSAAAFREAQRKGEPVAQGGHGHGALSPGAKAQPELGGHGASESNESDPAEHESAGRHATSGRGMSTSQPSAGAHVGHVISPQGGPRSPIRRDGSRQDPAPPGHAGMQHGSAAGGSTSPEQTARASRVSAPARKSAEASPGQPAGTLQPDPLDQAAETSVLDARRSAEMSQEMGGGHGMQHGTASYRQIDAGRDSVTTGQGSVSPRPPTAPDHGGMQHSSPSPTPPPGPRTTKPPPDKPTPAAPPPEPTHPPHHAGGSDGSSRHGEAAR